MTVDCSRPSTPRRFGTVHTPLPYNADSRNSYGLTMSDHPDIDDRDDNSTHHVQSRSASAVPAARPMSAGPGRCSPRPRSATPSLGFIKSKICRDTSKPTAFTRGEARASSPQQQRRFIRIIRRYQRDRQADEELDRNYPPPPQPTCKPRVPVMDFSKIVGRKPVEHKMPHYYTAEAAAVSGSPRDVAYSGVTQPRYRTRGFSMGAQTSREQRGRTSRMGKSEATDNLGCGAAPYRCVGTPNISSYTTREQRAKVQNRDGSSTGEGADRPLTARVERSTVHTPRFESYMSHQSKLVGYSTRPGSAGPTKQVSPLDYLDPNVPKIKGHVRFSAQVVDPYAGGQARVASEAGANVVLAYNRGQRHVRGVNIGKCTPRPPLYKTVYNRNAGSIPVSYSAIEPEPHVAKFSAMSSRDREQHNVRARQLAFNTPGPKYDITRADNITHPVSIRHVRVVPPATARKQPAHARRYS